jgi:hypothetical protein
MGITGPLPLLALQMGNYATPDAPIEWLGAVHSDFFPILDYVAPRGFYVGSKAAGAKLLDARREAPAQVELWVKDYLRSQAVTSAELSETVFYLQDHRGLFDRLYGAWAAEWLRRYPENAVARVAAQAARGPGYRHVLEATGRRTAADGAHGKAENKLRCRRLADDYHDTRSCLGTPLAGELEAELKWFLTQYPEAEDAEIHQWYGALLYDSGRHREAYDHLAQATRLLARQGRTSAATEAAVLACRSALAGGDPQAAGHMYRTVLAAHENELPVRLIRSRIERALSR